MHFLGISGSLRKQSYNTSALLACQQLLPPGVTMSLFDIAAIPLYNDDVYKQGFPDSVTQLREQILAADALVIATPEYNYSIPGVLKNAIDWVSRLQNQPFAGSEGWMATTKGCEPTMATAAMSRLTSARSSDANSFA